MVAAVDAARTVSARLMIVGLAGEGGTRRDERYTDRRNHERAVGERVPFLVSVDRGHETCSREDSYFLSCVVLGCDYPFAASDEHGGWAEEGDRGVEERDADEPRDCQKDPKTPSTFHRGREKGARERPQLATRGKRTSLPQSYSQPGVRSQS